MPKTSTNLDNNDATIVTLGDNDDYSGEKIIGYRFESEDIKIISSWKDMMIGVFKQIASTYPTELNNIAQRGLLGNALVCEEKDGHSEIAPGIWLQTASSTVNKLNVLRKLFNILDISVYDLEFKFEKITWMYI